MKATRAEPVHLHGKANSTRIDGPDAECLQFADDFSNHVVRLVNDMMKLDVRDGPHGSPDVLAIHPGIRC